MTSASPERALIEFQELLCCCVDRPTDTEEREQAILVLPHNSCQSTHIISSPPYAPPALPTLMISSMSPLAPPVWHTCIGSRNMAQGSGPHTHTLLQASLGSKKMYSFLLMVMPAFTVLIWLLFTGVFGILWVVALPMYFQRPVGRWVLSTRPNTRWQARTTLGMHAIIFRGELGLNWLPKSQHRTQSVLTSSHKMNARFILFLVSAKPQNMIVMHYSPHVGEAEQWRKATDSS